MCSFPWELSKGELGCGTSQNPRGQPQGDYRHRGPWSLQSLKKPSRVCVGKDKAGTDMLTLAPGRQPAALTSTTLVPAFESTRGT